MSAALNARELPIYMVVTRGRFDLRIEDLRFLREASAERSFKNAYKATLKNAKVWRKAMGGSRVADFRLGPVLNWKQPILRPLTGA
jgi:hypothetical protein